MRRNLFIYFAAYVCNLSSICNFFLFFVFLLLLFFRVCVFINNTQFIQRFYTYFGWKRDETNRIEKLDYDDLLL